MAPMSCMSHCRPHSGSPVDRLRARAVAVEVAALGLDVAPRRLRRRPGRVSDGLVARRALERRLAVGLLGEARIVRLDRRHADVGVLGDDRPAGVADGLMRRGGARALLVDHDVLVCHGRGRAHQHAPRRRSRRRSRGPCACWSLPPRMNAGRRDAGTHRPSLPLRRRLYPTACRAPGVFVGGVYAAVIMPAPTVSFVASSMRMNAPVARLRA